MDTLRAFVTVVEVGGFTQAGEILGRSQPAISLQIKKLEDLVEQKLLLRVGANIELTDAGKSLLNYAKRILAINDEAIASFNANEMSGSIRLGLPSEFALTLLPKILSRFCQTYPNVTLEVTSDLSRNLTSDFHKQRFDLVLALHSDPDKSTQDLITTDELVWVGNPDLPAATNKALPLIAAPDGCIYRNRVIERLNQKAIPWQIVFTIPDLTGIRTAIEEGLGITALAKSTVPQELSILKTSDQLPQLGKIGISLLSNDSSEASLRLSEYLQAGLSHV
ncbi:LysR substrate-binding domain-containing protein [Maricurvus nonylphenolicus]|uniref:LysR substrate-binding domain-containing protein n=1 Tax=Maricurvus nonylphenolicus TaxID=1008307 RepID=UPI0036F24712